MDETKNILPYGDALRDFLADGNISKSELRGILRNRGIFTREDDKTTTIPHLVTRGITPNELMELYQNISETEEEPKALTQTIKCSVPEVDLLSILPSSDEIHELVKKPFSNYELIGIPNFVSSIEGEVELDFIIERTDHTKSWDKNTKQFSGKVRFSKIDDELDINISLSHTSPETKEVASVISKEMVNRLKLAGFVKNDEVIRKIRFNDFTNENRVKFLNKLSKEQTSNELYFKDTRDLGFCPDETQTLPDDISWMQEKITNLLLQGKNLHSTVFIRQKRYHEYIKVYRVEASYSFDYDDCSGSCQISYEFPEFISKLDNSSELSIKVLNIRFKNGSNRSLAGAVKERTLKILEKSKLKLHDTLKNGGSS